MKLKIAVFLSAILMISANVFGQKPEPKAEAKPAPAAKLPTAKEILDKYVAAIGGRAANEKIKTRSAKGTVELAPMGVKGTVESFAAAPGKTYVKITLNGIGDIIDGFDGTSAWQINPLTGNRVKAGSELAQTKLSADFYRDINLDKLYGKLDVTGTEKVGDRDAYVVVATPTGLEPETFYFDTQTGLLLRTDATAVSPEGSQKTKTFFEDYREVDGVKIPFKLRSQLPQFELVMTFTEAKANVPVDDKIFTKPADK